MKKWSDTWDRIRAKQAADKLAAGIDIQPEDLSPEDTLNLHDAEARAAAPAAPEHLPPLPPGTRYGGTLDDYDNMTPVQGHAFAEAFDSAWTECHEWLGTKGCPQLLASGDPVWHIAIPIDEQPEPELVQYDKVSVTRAAAIAIGERMWHDMTDDDCRLRATEPRTFAAYLERQLFPEQP